MKDLPVKVLPKALPFKKILGPSFILLGLGLGSGEVILWPYLTSNFGLGIIWAAVLGITLQFIMNMEIERYALARGESIFVGYRRVWRFLPLWFIFSTFIPWLWPGIAASSAKIIGHVFGIDNIKYLSIFFLILMGIILSFGKTLYKSVETFQKLIIGIGVPAIFLLSILIAKNNDWVELGKGLVGIGEDYWLLPIGIPMASFLAAFAYSGAGGNLNLAQSFYVKEKGYGMGKYASKIKNILAGNSKDFHLEGSKFELTNENIKEFKKWWKVINLEHFIVFLVTGALTIVLLGLLSHATTFGLSGTKDDINFVILESQEIGKLLFPAAGIFFLLVAGLTLFGTQLTVFDAASRILSENIILSNGKISEKHLGNIYYSVLWALIIGGIVISALGFNAPLQLLTIAAVLNAVAMFVHSGLTLYTNHKLLDKPLRPTKLRFSLMLIAFLTYGGFSVYTAWNILSKIF